jgi:hypothetical protein
MRRRSRAGGKAVKPQRHRTLKRGNAAKVGRKSPAIDAAERIALLEHKLNEVGTAESDLGGSASHRQFANRDPAGTGRYCNDGCSIARCSRRLHHARRGAITESRCKAWVLSTMGDRNDAGDQPRLGHGTSGGFAVTVQNHDVPIIQTGLGTVAAASARQIAWDRVRTGCIPAVAEARR